jgi:hypothetical protein
VSNITRNCQRSAEAGVHHQPNLRQRSGDHGMSNVNRTTTYGCAPGGIRTPDPWIGSPVPPNLSTCALLVFLQVAHPFRVDINGQ